MKNQKIQNVLLLIAIVLLVSCQNSMKSTKNTTSSHSYPSATGFNLDNSDAAAILIADQVMQAQGGYENWENTHFIKWKGETVRPGGHAN